MGRRETGLLERLFNYMTGTGTTVTRTSDFWGNKKTIVHNYDTGTTKEYTHHQGFFSDHTDVKVLRDGEEVARGNIKRDFWGRGIETLEHTRGKARKTVKKMDLGFWGNKDQTCQYDDSGREIGRREGRRGLIFDSYTQEYTGVCWRCDGTGIFQKTGKPCRKCGGTGVYRKTKKS